VVSFSPLLAEDNKFHSSKYSSREPQKVQKSVKWADYTFIIAPIWEKSRTFAPEF
jgi:hypothetical protein